MFEEVTFPLGPRALKGQWIICVPDIIDEDKMKNCINFYVTDEKEDDYNINNSAYKTDTTNDKVRTIVEIWESPRNSLGVLTSLVSPKEVW